MHGGALWCAYIVMIHACNHQQLSSWEWERLHRKLPGPELLLAAGNHRQLEETVSCQPCVPSWPMTPHCGQVVCWFPSCIGIKIHFLTSFLSHSPLPSSQLLVCVISNLTCLPKEIMSFLADLPLLHLLTYHLSCSPAARCTQTQKKL